METGVAIMIILIVVTPCILPVVLISLWIWMRHKENALVEGGRRDEAYTNVPIFGEKRNSSIFAHLLIFFWARDHQHR